MHPETPRMNLRGFSSMTGILAICAKDTSMGGARRL